MAALDEEALKQFIARLPDQDKEHERDRLGEEEITYIYGVRDAYRVLTGEQPLCTNIVDSLVKHAEKMRNHVPNWRASGLSDTLYCQVCGTPKPESGDLPWHSSPA
jgi:hypothetical protein